MNNINKKHFEDALIFHSHVSDSIFPHNKHNNEYVTLLTNAYQDFRKFSVDQTRPWLLNRKSKHYAKVKQYWLQIGVFAGPSYVTQTANLSPVTKKFHFYYPLNVNDLSVYWHNVIAFVVLLSKSRLSPQEIRHGPERDGRDRSVLSLNFFGDFMRKLPEKTQRRALPELWPIFRVRAQRDLINIYHIYEYTYMLLHICKYVAELISV